MTRIDFYTNVADPQAFACRLADTVQRKREQLLIWLDSERSVEVFSNRLWSHGDTRFVPHCRLEAAEAGVTPVWLTARLPDDLAHPVLLNLGPELPYAIERFERILEIVGRDPASLATARERFRAYREHGCAIEHHDMSQTPS
ncbi:DNA polymerase III subunit chi [Chromobacterium sphagni]|uniref:DNA polymerase III subunit chi n=1 Tax=Chromobacterium sphagni TaxID=1903179 RepID=A0ABX3CBX2_9NEIS|nr:DNA polymerase III subunit chi [Chromobacterium sphagni]OHX19781.1 DNA polymerase III subunit chi [Chromobacterium sphagni]